MTVSGDMASDECRMTLGIDVGGTNIRIAEIDSTGRIVRHHSERVMADRTGFMERIVQLVMQWPESRAAAVGVGIPGRVEATTGTILSAGYLDIAGTGLVERLANLTQRPVVIENDCGAALVAEFETGAARGLDDAVMFAIGTGIGGAIAHEGTLVRGAGTAGQLGHLTVRPDGSECKCGRRGCVETTSSGTALGKLMNEHGIEAGTGVEHLFDRASADDGKARHVLMQWAAPMRDAVTSMIAALDPQAVIVGGGLGEAMVRAMALLAPEKSWYERPVLPGILGNDAGMIGAALLARRSAGLRICGKMRGDAP